jgi:hypothetical protein
MKMHFLNAAVIETQEMVIQNPWIRNKKLVQVSNNRPHIQTII